MGLFDWLRNKKKPTKSKENDAFSVSPEIEKLLWFGDGPKKNYVRKSEEKTFSVAGNIFRFRLPHSVEPSAIFTEYPIQTENLDHEFVSRVPYYPTYEGLDPAQRGFYWRFLKDPFSAKYDLGYLFLFYYGLERQLMEGDIDDAFNMILKLRSVYKNGSFQFYSCNAIVLTCLFRQRADLAQKFFLSLDQGGAPAKIPGDLYFLCKSGLNLPVEAQDLIRFSESFGFTNRRYIDRFPSVFADEVKKAMVKATGLENWSLAALLQDKRLEGMTFAKRQLFANVSLQDKEISFPDFCSYPVFKKLCFDILQTAHEEVKKKSKDLPVPPADQKKTAIVPSFNPEQESQLLSSYESSPDRFHRHFVSMSLQDFYYQYRGLDEKYLKKCEEYCIKDIEDLPNIERDFLADNKAHGYLLNLKHLDVRITAFDRLAIIYSKEKRFDDCLRLCDQAIEYYSLRGMGDQVKVFAERKQKILLKISSPKNALIQK